MTEVTIIGPVVPAQVSGGLIYQVTLASGAIATSPRDFGEPVDERLSLSPVVSEAGQLLTAARAE